VVKTLSDQGEHSIGFFGEIPGITLVAFIDKKRAPD
jgi:hypothetical protein